MSENEYRLSVKILLKIIHLFLIKETKDENIELHENDEDIWNEV